MSHSVEDMTALYDECDKNNDQQVSVHELRDGIKARLCPGVKDDVVAAIFMGLDMDGDNKISKQEFIDMMCHKLDRRIGFTKKFEELDADKSGSLTKEEVAPLIAQFNLADDCFDKVDTDSSGKVSLEEFLKLM